MQTAALALHPKRKWAEPKISQLTIRRTLKDVGSDKLLKLSRALADLTSWYDDVDGEEQRKISGIRLATQRKGWRDLYTDNLFPEIMN